MTTADKKNKPLVSIVMPVRNAGKFLREAINSVQNQTYKNWELVLLSSYEDSGS